MSTPAHDLALAYIIKKWELEIPRKMPVKIPDMGRNRESLAKLYCELGYRVGAEIGTCAGSFATRIIRHNPECKLFCIDPWTLYEGMNDFKDADQMYEYELMAKQRLAPLPGVTIIKAFSMDAVKNFKDESLDFVYIDANHEWPYVTQDVFYWAKKVRSGGLVSGHDYDLVRREDGMCQVKEVVEGYTKAFDISPWFVLDKTNSLSWLWVKP